VQQEREAFEDNVPQGAGDGAPAETGEPAAAEVPPTEAASPAEPGPPEPEPDWRALAEERYEQILRLRADFENLRRRVERERLEYHRQLLGGIVLALLPVYDNLERAVKFMPNEGEAKAWRLGVEMTLKGFDDLLGQWGVEPIAAVGQPFDPALHEAIQRVPSDQPEGTVVEELVRGFRMGDRVLRASQVKVAEAPKAPATESPAAPTE
jgi:molecular chaperone GrpE